MLIIYIPQEPSDCIDLTSPEWDGGMSAKATPFKQQAKVLKQLKEGNRMDLKEADKFLTLEPSTPQVAKNSNLYTVYNVRVNLIMIGGITAQRLRHCQTSTSQSKYGVGI